MTYVQVFFLQSRLPFSTLKVIVELKKECDIIDVLQPNKIYLLYTFEYICEHFNNLTNV